MSDSSRVRADLELELADMDEILAERRRLDQLRREYLEALLAAVDGDESKTWAEAHRVAYGTDPT